MCAWSLNPAASAASARPAPAAMPCRTAASRRSITRPPPSFAAGFALAIANPKEFAAFGALHAGRTLVAGAPLADAVAKLAVLTLLIAAVHPAWLAAGAAFARTLSHPRFGRLANLAFAAMLLAAAALALRDQYFAGT